MPCALVGSPDRLSLTMSHIPLKRSQWIQTPPEKVFNRLTPKIIPQFHFLRTYGWIHRGYVCSTRTEKAVRSRLTRLSFFPHFDDLFLNISSLECFMGYTLLVDFCGGNQQRQSGHSAGFRVDPDTYNPLLTAFK